MPPPQLEKGAAIPRGRGGAYIYIRLVGVIRDLVSFRFRDRLLPPEAILSVEEAVKMTARAQGGVGVISHGWLSASHPDPQKARRNDIKEVDMAQLSAK